MGRPTKVELEPTRRWLREAGRLRARLEEAVSREKLLARMDGPSDALERARGQQRAATDVWAASWAARAKAIDKVPRGQQAAVLGYKYLQGYDMAWISVRLGINLKTAYRLEAQGVEWIQNNLQIKKEPR